MTDAVGSHAMHRARSMTKGVTAKAAFHSYLAADAALPNPQKKIADADIDLINLYSSDTVATRCTAYTKS